MYPSRVGVHPALLEARDRLLAGQPGRVPPSPGGPIPIDPGYSHPVGVDPTGVGHYTPSDTHQYSGGVGLGPAPGPVPIDPGYSHPVGGGSGGLVPANQPGRVPPSPPLYGAADSQQAVGLGQPIGHHIGQAHAALGALAHALALRGLS